MIESVCLAIVDRIPITESPCYEVMLLPKSIPSPQDDMQCLHVSPFCATRPIIAPEAKAQVSHKPTGQNNRTKGQRSVPST